MQIRSSIKNELCMYLQILSDDERAYKRYVFDDIE